MRLIDYVRGDERHSKELESLEISHGASVQEESIRHGEFIKNQNFEGLLYAHLNKNNFKPIYSTKKNILYSNGLDVFGKIDRIYENEMKVRSCQPGGYVFAETNGHSKFLKDYLTLKRRNTQCKILEGVGAIPFASLFPVLIASVVGGGKWLVDNVVMNLDPKYGLPLSLLIPLFYGGVIGAGILAPPKIGHRMLKKPLAEFYSCDPKFGFSALKGLAEKYDAGVGK